MPDETNNGVMIFRKDDTTLGEALHAFKGPLAGAVALVYGQERCAFGKFADGALVYHRNAAPVFTYEARVFNNRHELRWLAKGEKFGHATDSIGTCVFLTEDKELKVPESWLPDTSLTGVLPLEPHHYVLWGQLQNGSRAESGWTELFEHRIGSLFVPVAMERGANRIVFHFVEYAAVDDPHGNMAVVAERLTGLGSRRYCG